MRPNQAIAQSGNSKLEETIRSACESIAPVWPLDRFIAVNPFHGWSAVPFEETAEKLQQLGGASLLMPADYYREAWDKGLIRAKHLESVINELGAPFTAEECLRELDSPLKKPVPRPMLSDILDSRRDLLHEPAWGEVIIRQISRYCAAWFDESSADWGLNKEAGLYAGWKEAIRHEHGITLLMHDGDILKRSGQLPNGPRVLIENLLEELELGEDAALDLLEAALLRINGWASWCAYLRWQARLDGKDDSVIEDLLAIRLAWEWLLDDGRRDASSPWRLWKNAWTRPVPENKYVPTLHIWQRALELGYQTRMAKTLCVNKTADRSQPPAAQMAFCIDVRSEVIRRAIETLDPRIQTLGFAGFFGLPIAYQALGTTLKQPLLPGLFKPQYTVSDSTGEAPTNRRLEKKLRARLSRRAQTGPFQKMPASAFTLVEALGLGFVAKMLARTLHYVPSGRRNPAVAKAHGEREARLHPVFSEAIPSERKVDLVAGILKTMSLTEDFASLVVLVGHGSKTINNPHAAGLDCGACGGQTGEVNVRLLASLLNDTELRRALRERKLYIPEGTFFLPALHNTATDEINILDAGDLPESHCDKLADLQNTLLDAGHRARAERSNKLGLGKLANRPGRLLKAMRKRTLDWSQTRPEWGLANNAAFIAAPRNRTLGIDLQGRAFLHDYDPDRDEGGEILESIMTGPMIVATWINMQYYASTVDNKRFGSGNKVLHNVAGGSIGVFEGNGGDLRTGLPMQSLHDGRQWIHTPQRLSIYLEAETRYIETVLDKHSLVRDLVDNDWVFLFRIDRARNTIERYYKSTWSITKEATALD